MSSCTVGDSSSSRCGVSIEATTSVDKENLSCKQLVLSLGSNLYLCIIGEDKLTSITDGSGVRGYASLLILKALMERIAVIEDSQHYSTVGQLPLPCHYFDYIFGTSTGGWVQERGVKE
jgi:hypothetical protein